MNHLAHFHLSGSCSAHIAGALLADYLRGPVDAALPRGIADGVRLHRRIDAFTDSHEAVRALRRLFPSPQRRLAGIAIDIFFDHVLARRWQQFDPRPLAGFGHAVYGALDREAGTLAPAAREHARRMRHHDVLPRYADAAFTLDALEHTGSRVGLGPLARRAGEHAAARVADIEEAFLRVYPEAQALAREALSAASGTR